MTTSLRTWLLLLLPVQRVQTAARNLHDLETNTWDIPDSVAAPAKASNEYFVVLVDEIQATIPRNECGDLLAILDQLHTAALTDGRVRLLRLDADLLHDDSLRVRSATEGIALVLGPEIGLLVILIC